MVTMNAQKPHVGPCLPTMDKLLKGEVLTGGSRRDVVVCTTQSVVTHPTAQLSLWRTVFMREIRSTSEPLIRRHLRFGVSGTTTFYLLLILFTVLTVRPGWAAPAVHLESVV